MLAIWLYGSVARGDDRPDSDLDILVIAEAVERQRVVDCMRDELLEPGRKLGFSPSVIGLEPADIVRLVRSRDAWWESAAADAVVLFGSSPQDMVEKSSGKDAA